MADLFVRNENGLSLAGDTIRIEQGPALVRAVATSEILSNEVTADHYQPDRLDALAQPIVEGEDFHYLDYLKTRAPGADHVFYLYQLLPPTPEEQAARAHDGTGDAGLPATDGSEPFFHQVGVYDTEAEAINAALQLMGS